MTNYYPDRFVILKLNDENEEIYKVFGSWMGGYLTGDNWRMNSGIEKIVTEDESIHFYGYSGSVYSVDRDSYGVTTWSGAVLASMLEDCTIDASVLTKEEAFAYIESRQNE